MPMNQLNAISELLKDVSQRLTHIGGVSTELAADPAIPRALDHAKKAQGAVARAIQKFAAKAADDAGDADN